MVKRVVAAAAACGAVLGLSASTASGAVDQTVFSCEGTATWNVTVNLVGPSSAARTHGDGIEVCKRVHAVVQDDSNFSIVGSEGDTGPSTNDHDLIGAGVTGVPVFAGWGTSPAGTRGPIVIVGDSLAAKLTNVDSAPSFVATEVHTPDGKCGPTCWRTKAVWTGTYSN